MNNNYAKKSICISLALLQCLVPLFAQTPSAAASVSPEIAGAVEAPAASVASTPQILPQGGESATPAALSAGPGGTANALAAAVRLSSASAAAPVEGPLRVPVEVNYLTASGQRYPDPVLRLVERSHTGAAVGLMVVGLFFGAGFLPPGKENNRGSKIDAVAHPLFPGMAQSVSQWAAVNKPGHSFKNPITIRPDTFLLVYSDLTSDQAVFELQAHTSVTRKPDSGGWFTAPESVSCSNIFNEDKLTLEQWQADDYSEVKKRMAQHRQECISTVVAALPKLLKN